MTTQPRTQATLLERLLQIFTEVKPGEGLSAVLLTFNVFALLTSYYIIKPVRDALINAMEPVRLIDVSVFGHTFDIVIDGPEVKSYMGGIIAIALLVAVPAYSRLASKQARNRLVVGVTLFFASNLVLFAVGTRMPGSSMWLPPLFYLWAGIFNMMVVAQFWAFANDIYTEPQGKRLFALIGIGASAGATFGGALAKWLPIRPQAALEGGCSAVTQYVGYLSTFHLMILAGGLLCICAFLTQLVHRRETRSKTSKGEIPDPKIGGKELSPITGKSEGAFTMVFRHRYLLLLAGFSLIFTLVNTNGEYMISKLVKKFVFESVGQCSFASSAIKSSFIDGMFTSWYGDFYFWVNLVGVLVQSLAVSRFVKWGGLAFTFFILPVIATLGAMSLLLFPFLGVLRPAKITENATDYSVNNTVRNMLWLPTTRAMKYKAKQAVDTFFVRMGDVSSALVVVFITQVIGFSPSATDPAIHSLVRLFAGINVALIGVWIWIAVQIIRENRKLKRQRELEQDKI